jgi:arsenite oxidase small subunit
MARCRMLADVGRRQFLRGGGAAAAAAVTAGAAPTPARATPALARVDYPSTRLANIAELKVDEPIDIAYPDEASPGVLLKLGAPVEGGAGPEGDIVAFSTQCPHKGYPLQYVAEDRTLNCPGHYSRFDCEKGGFQVWGMATQNLAQFRLRIDAQGDIHAAGVDELIYGRTSNVLQG